MQLVIRDANQGPFLTQVLRFGRDNERLTEQQLAAIKGKAVLMSLKFADKYYNKYKMHLLEQAAHDVIGVVSLGLQELSARDPAKAPRRPYSRCSRSRRPRPIPVTGARPKGPRPLPPIPAWGHCPRSRRPLRHPRSPPCPPPYSPSAASGLPRRSAPSSPRTAS